MTEAVAEIDEAPKPKGKKGLILGIILALIGAGAGFGAVKFGLIPNKNETDANPADAEISAKVKDAENVTFVEIEPILITLNGGAAGRQLKFRTQLEVSEQHAKDVERITPRIVDVMNSYLRALTLDDLRDSLALVRLRSQLLRRIELVAGTGVVRDLLVMEFVLN